MKVFLFFISALFLTNCNNLKVTFMAFKIKSLGIEKIEIYEDNKFKIFYNDTIIYSGNAFKSEDKIILSEEPKSFRQTLIQSKIFLIKGRNLCPLIFIKNTDSIKRVLQIPNNQVNKNDCYRIKINNNIIK